MTQHTTPSTDQQVAALTDQQRVLAATASAALGLVRVDERRSGQIGLIKEHSPLQARLRVEEGDGAEPPRLVARMTGRVRGGVEVGGQMADLLERLTEHFTAPVAD